MVTNPMWRCLKINKSRSSANSDASDVTKKLEKELTKRTCQFDNAVKILLLGTGESGKTTILKQMKILHMENGFTMQERLSNITEIQLNIHESIYELCRNVPRLGLEFDSHANREHAKRILAMGRFVYKFYNAEYVSVVKALWMDSAVQQCFKRNSEFQLIDSAKYFLDKIDETSLPGYVPSNEDILLTRKMTTGIREVTFQVKIPSSMGGGYQEFRMFDVGGQRDQRNKWMQAFEGIQAILFLISCGDFDQTLREDPQQNRLAEAIKLFDRVWQNRFLCSAGVIVFLNKQDIMEQKIRAGKSIGAYFPDYYQYRLSARDGNVFDEFNKTRCFIRQQLVEVTKVVPRRLSQIGRDIPRECFFHFTVATDTRNIKKVFNDVHNIILTRNLADMGLL